MYRQTQTLGSSGRQIAVASSLPYQQFTRSYIKQQIHDVRVLGDAAVLAQKPRTQQLLGWYTRVVTTLDEYYRPEHECLYRKGQG